MTGDETYGDANHRIEYKADGTYTYYEKDGESWVPDYFTVSMRDGGGGPI